MPRPPTLPTLDWQEIFNNGRTYADWLEHAENAEHRERMEAARRTQRLPQDVTAFLAKLPKPVHIVSIAEDWCGDVVKHVPVLQRLEDECPNLHVQYIAREDRPDVFARFLTNGGEAIPKFVFLSDKFVECGNWGPMPSACREFIARGKGCGDVAKARELVSAAYAADSENETVVRELVQCIDIAGSESPDPASSLWASTRSV